MDDGSTIKEFQENEQDFALQATVPTVVSEDERYLVRPPPLPPPHFIVSCGLMINVGTTADAARARVPHKLQGLFPRSGALRLSCLCDWSRCEYVGYQDRSTSPPPSPLPLRFSTQLIKTTSTF